MLIFKLHPKAGFAIAFVLVAAIATPIADADIIRLKNGRSIVADSAREVNGRIEYNIGEDTYAIPKSSVEKIDTGGTPIVSRPEEIPVPAPGNELKDPGNLEARIIRNGSVDIEALAAIERNGNRNEAGIANFLASRYERSRNHLEQAERYMSRARGFFPEDGVLLGQHASILLQMSRFREAAAMAGQATRIAPAEAFSWAILGYANMQLGKGKDAVRALKKSVELQPNGNIQDLLARAERELAAESGFQMDASSHFLLSYEGEQVAAPLRRQLLDTLEQHYDDLVRELNYAPRENIAVVLYTDRQFFDVTQAPQWIGAINDGKLRLPINGVQSVTPHLSRVLKHELTHSFISQITHNHCPSWLNEGVAQMLEPRTSRGEGPRLAALYATQRNIPLNQLETSFVRLSDSEAAIAYAQALTVAEYIRDTYGMSQVTDILQRIGSGQSTEAALRGAIHSGYAQLEDEVRAQLKRTYGD